MGRQYHFVAPSDSQEHGLLQSVPGDNESARAGQYLTFEPKTPRHKAAVPLPAFLLLVAYEVISFYTGPMTMFPDKSGTSPETRPSVAMHMYGVRV